MKEDIEVKAMESIKNMTKGFRQDFKDLFDHLRFTFDIKVNIVTVGGNEILAKITYEEGFNHEQITGE